MVHRCCEQNSASKTFCCHGKVVTMAANANLTFLDDKVL